jgi:acyl-CoA dehydrogenase family member 9
MDEEQKQLAEELFFGEAKKPSFAKLLYSGQLDSKTVYPYPKIDAAEQRHTDEILAQLESFCKKELNPDAIDREGRIPESVIKGLGKLGILGLSVPEKYGGLGMTQYAYCKVIELLAGHCGSTALLVNAHQSIGLKAILLFGTEQQKSRWLRPLATGDQLAAFSLTEADAGSDAAGIETRADYDPLERVYRINGKKQWTTNGSIASVLTVMAKTEGNTITAFLVTPEMPGFHVVDRALEKVGYRGTWTANLSFTNLEVPEENILGPKGKGLKVCLTVLDYGRTTFGAACTGIAKYLVHRALEYAVQRHQFKRSLASFSLVKQKLSRMSALAYAMDASTYLTAGLIDAEEEDIMLETAILKVFASESLWQILYDTMQLFGGRSFFTDEPFERLMRDARINMIGEGSNEVLRAFIGAAGLHDVGVQFDVLLRAFKNPFPKLRVFNQFAQEMWRRIRKPVLPVQSAILRTETERLCRSVRRFSVSIVRLLAKYREGVIEEQLKLNRIAECAISLYTTTAVLSKIDGRLPQMSGASSRLAHDIDIARFYCNYAFDRLDRSLDLLMSNNRDKDTETLSDALTGVHYQ